MANLKQENALVLAADSLTSSSTQQHQLGARAIDRFGRVYHYAQAGAVDLVAGNVLQGPAIIPDHLATTATAAALGATAVTFTPGATAGAAALYEGGLMGVDTTPDNGYTYGIASHAAITASVAFTLNLASDEPITGAALSTASRLGLLQSLYKGVIQFPVTTATGLVAGVANYVIPATYWGWIQTWGPASVLIVGTPALGAYVMTPSSTAGSAIILTTTNLVVAQIVGTMAQVGVSGKNNFVRLKIDP